MSASSFWCRRFFLLWGFCSGLLDQSQQAFPEFALASKFQSGFVQNAFYMGYFLMALPPAGSPGVSVTKAESSPAWSSPARRVLVFIPAVRIDTYWAFRWNIWI